MAFRLKITLKTKKKLVVLIGRPMSQWCEACGAESTFVDEGAESAALTSVPAVSSQPHRLFLNGRSYLCLRSMKTEP